MKELHVLINTFKSDTKVVLVANTIAGRIKTKESHQLE